MRKVSWICSALFLLSSSAGETAAKPKGRSGTKQSNKVDSKARLTAEARDLNFFLQQQFSSSIRIFIGTTVAPATQGIVSRATGGDAQKIRAIGMPGTYERFARDFTVLFVLSELWRGVACRDFPARSVS